MEPGGCPSVLAAARDGGTRPHANAAKIIENGRRLSQVPDDDDETKLLGCFLRADFGRANGLGAMLVSPRARGRGLGKALMAAALDATPADRAACPVILASCSPMGQPMYVRRADSSLTNRGDDAVAATWIFRGDGVAATPRRRRGRSVETGARRAQVRKNGARPARRLEMRHRRGSSAESTRGPSKRGSRRRRGSSRKRSTVFAARGDAAVCVPKRSRRATRSRAR